MKRILSLTAVFGVILVASAASAQYREQTVLLTFGAGTLLATEDGSGENLTGAAAGFTLERVLAGSKFNVGGTLFWLWADESVVLEGDTNASPISLRSTPFVLTGRYNFLNSRVAANIGLGIGVHTTRLYLDRGTVDERESSFTGMVISVPVELAYFIDPDLYLQFTYTPSHMSTTPLRDDLAHAFALSLGFAWGGD